jgi:hypothetical protein
MNDAFLNCNIWSVHLLKQPYIEHNFYSVANVYYYNSLNSGIYYFDLECVQIPEFEIRNINLLDNIDFDFVNKYSIPILYRDKDGWKIDLRIYEDFKLQPANIQSNC